MNFNTTQIELARQMDAQDELAHFRGQFVNNDPNLIYLDGNSLGRLPLKTVDYMDLAIREQWGDRLIRSWNEAWYHQSSRLGKRIAQIIGAHPDDDVYSMGTLGLLQANGNGVLREAVQVIGGAIQWIDEPVGLPPGSRVIRNNGGFFR